jgi:hypothetical protein
MKNQVDVAVIVKNNHVQETTDVRVLQSRYDFYEMTEEDRLAMER